MFFSVKREIKIAGKTYIPCVCYPVTKFLERTVQKLSEEGKAVIKKLIDKYGVDKVLVF